LYGAQVTLNICLQQDEELLAAEEATAAAEEAAAEAAAAHSSQLRFCGFVGDAAHRQRTLTLRHAVGRAVLHLGAHRHGATDVAHGTRQSTPCRAEGGLSGGRAREWLVGPLLGPRVVVAGVDCGWAWIVGGRQHT
jgi:hypothetical protein